MIWSVRRLSEENMNYGKIINCDTANGIGLRVSLFVSGCCHRCEGCFNSETWNPKFGIEFTSQTISHICELLAPSYVQGITVLGGEPMMGYNQADVYLLLKTVKEKFPNKDVWMYSGFTFEELLDESNPFCSSCYTKDILNLIDVLVDGRFVLGKKSLMLKFRGSSNQRIIDVKQSLDKQDIVLIQEYM